ncbi:aminotransferase-like domain-containing protein [Sphingobium sp. YR768]|uniref:aminotransferase-like domain-containing protein n=1 Tax=Sphingobium sp. YR768 TaxID=1884365 RepID=UPI0008C98EB4|nr:PLP-dependent aminotransferase family protein [Sphingobium sp. YR768]SER53713.1 transcriptional regulator, GntR family [Sphingobium sp. YR768]
MSREAALPKYLALAETLQKLILGGDFAPGAKLPSVRSAMRRFGVSKNTLIAAYAYLEMNGAIHAKDRSGYYVSQEREDETVRLPYLIDHPLSLVEQKGQDILTDLEALRSRQGYDLLSPMLDPKLLPQGIVARLARKILAEDLRACLTPDFGPGYRPLRHALAGYYRAREIAADDRDFVTTLGCTHALVAAVEASTAPGDTIAIRTPTFYPLLRIIHSLNRRIIEIPSTANRSRDLERLEEAIERFSVRACFISVSLPDPYGAGLSDDAKRHLLNLAERYDLAMIEDDVFGHVSLRNHAMRPLKAFDQTGRVLHCSSLSKTLGSGLRVGWCMPGRYAKAMQNVRSIVAPAMPVFEQALVARLLESASFARHVGDLKLNVRQNLQTLQHALGEGLLAGSSLTSRDGGLLAWVRLPEGTSANTVYKAALERNVAVAPGGIYSLADRFDDHIRLFLGIETHNFRRAISILARNPS